MHRLKINLVMVLCALCLLVNSADAGAWGPLNTSMAGGAINDIAIDPVTPTTVFVSASDGFYKSMDGGITYSPVFTGVTQDFFSHIVINPITPSTVYIQGPWHSGVYKSVDGGANWTLSVGAWTTTAITIDPLTPTTVYFHNVGAGIFKSIDAGISWSRLPNSAFGIVYFLLPDLTTPSTFYVGSSLGITKRTGATWVSINTGLTNLDVRAMAINPLIPSTLYAGTFGGGIFKSVDSGATWAAMNTGLGNLTIQALAIDPLMPAILYAATAGGVFQSVDGGTNWAAINTGLASFNVLSIAIDPKNPSIVYVGNGAGIQKGVFDSIAPVISLNGNANVSIVQGAAYNDAGATAQDNIDGDITANITVVNPVNTAVVGSYTITYNVSDAAGNAAAQASRVVQVTAPVDQTPPIITLTGVSPVTLTQGAAYTDAGATALDNVDGNISVNITVVNPVNTAVLGSYTITYKVSDAAGNAAVQVSRMVNIAAAGTTANGSSAQVALAGGGTVDIVSTGQYISSFSALAATGTVPTGMQFPFGMVAYQTTSPVGGSQTVNLTFSSALPSNAVLYKVDNAGIFTLLPKGAGENAWTQANANTIAITLTDGGAFDLDGLANGVIVDPVVVGSPTAPVAAATTTTSSGGGGGCSLNRSVSFDPMMLIMMILSLVYLVKTSKRKGKC